MKDPASLGPTGFLTQKATPQDRKSKQIHQMHRSKHKETTKRGRQRNNPQTKEKEKSPEKVLSEIKARNLSDTEFKVMALRRFRNLEL